MDGVITDTMKYHAKSWRIIFKNHGVHVDELEIYKREGQKGIVSIRGFFDAVGKKFIHAEAQAMLDEKEELFKQISKQKYIIGSRSFLKMLKREGFELALVTGTAKHEMHRILPENLRNIFDAIVTGSDVKHGKPHKEPYAKALKMLGRNASECVVIENAPLGIASAKGAGIQCLALETSLPKSYLIEAGADQVFHSFNHMLQSVEFKKP